MLTDVGESDLEPIVDIPRGEVEHVVLFHPTETFSLIEDLALPEVPPGADLRLGDTAGRIRMAIAAHAAQTVLNVGLRELTILWEDAGGAPPKDV